MSQSRELLDLYRFQPSNNRFSHLSLEDLVAARDLYHVHLMNHENVVATAIGRYRIRKQDSWPNEREHVKGIHPRRLDNSEIRPYSWPCVLVFVEQWKQEEELADAGQLVPKTLFMPDGRCVPVCIVEAPIERKTSIEARDVRFPTNNIGPGFPIVAEVQGRRYLATIGCLVSDGHRVYGLTNRHVTGAAGEPVFSMLDGKQVRIGVSAEKQLTRLPFTDVYPSLPGRDTYLNLDMGLIDIDDLSRWTTRVRTLPAVGPMVDFSDQQLSLSLVGCHVRGVGAAGGDMRGEVHGLFYRYKTRGGFEYVADLYIGPRAADAGDDDKPVEFATLPGDSGTMWMLEPVGGEHDRQNGKREDAEPSLRPLALQWGRNMLYSGVAAPPQGFALATLMSRACDLLDVDPIREWNVDQPDTWGAMGHFAIGARSVGAVSNRFPRLAKLLKNNATIISRSENALMGGDFSGMGSASFVPMADVPDFFWKPRVAQQGYSRAGEGPNHFADMDQPGPDGKTLLDLTADPANIDPARWSAFYDTVKDLMSGQPIEPAHRGLLPFRVWQIFDAMVDFAGRGQGHEFVCAAGVLAHYIGDACQPLHISYLHDGDPTRPVEHTFTRGKKEGQTEKRPLGQGIHSLYEDTMIHRYREDILQALATTPAPAAAETVEDGFEAARKTIEMMRTTFGKVPPMDLVEAHVAFGKGGEPGAENLWKQFGDSTIEVMKAGTHLLAVLWENAWRLGDGETKVHSVEHLTQSEAMAIVRQSDFLPSRTIDQVGAVLVVHH
jgi:hypothetical protein